MKKVEINQTETIYWSKPQWVQHINKPTLIVLTTGTHAQTLFQGTAMPCFDYPDGRFKADWPKEKFRPLVGEIQFTISNED